MVGQFKTTVFDWQITLRGIQNALPIIPDSVGNSEQGSWHCLADVTSRGSITSATWTKLCSFMNLNFSKLGSDKG